MTTKEQDTDPSTPGAMRGLAPTDPTPTPLGVAGHVSTDPGVGPPSQPPMPTAAPMQSGTQRIRTPPMGIIVPASMRVKPRKDSVELLLEGMQGPQPERPKTMPQTDGQASASYHAEHMVRPARTSPDEVPKVVVERPPQAPTTRIDRARVQAVIDAAEARRRTNEATAVLPLQIAPRVVVAIIAGVMVVLGLFVVLRLAMGGKGTPAAPSATHALAPAPTLAPIPTVSPTPSLAPAPAPAPTETAAASTAPTETPAATAARPAATTAWSSSPPGSAKPKTPRAAPTAGSSDIGEFKTTFH